MKRITIAQATMLLSELLDCMEDLYWESQTMQMKDASFNVVRILNAELMELTKVSVQDHHYPYEVISCSTHTLAQVLEDVKEDVTGRTLRSRTRATLDPLLQQMLDALQV